jgi:hypothetical protein
LICNQIGLFTLIKLGYVESKTARFYGSQKFWHMPNLREWWVGEKKLAVGDGDTVAWRHQWCDLNQKNNDLEKGCVFWAQLLEF